MLKSYFSFHKVMQAILLKPLLAKFLSIISYCVVDKKISLLVVEGITYQ